MAINFLISAFSIDQRPGWDMERLCKLFDDRKGRVPSPALDITDISPMNAGTVGVIFLTPALGLAQLANIETKALTNIHIR